MSIISACVMTGFEGWVSIDKEHVLHMLMLLAYPRRYCIMSPVVVVLDDVFDPLVAVQITST